MPPPGDMTPKFRTGSRILGLISLVISLGCGRAEAGEACLGVSDKGVFGDLDGKVQLALPEVRPDAVSALVDPEHEVLIVEIDGFPRKAYPLGGSALLKAFVPVLYRFRLPP